MTERDIFIAALQQPGPAERAAYLDRACGGDPALRGRVVELLREQEQLGSFLEQPAEVPGGTGPFTPASGEVIPTAPAEGPGAVIGPYKLLQQIGEGGMGAVFMAEQTQPVQRKVALKLIKPGMDTRQVVARFEAERQALALMDHPNIARVFDAGATDGGRPFFVMELVKGVPLTKYCDEHRLTPKQRLELFASVCQAVQHAHQKGIIHRDLKPSNVLVALYDGKPVPKVIDFGVAKATGQKLTERTLFTEFGSVVGTLDYMSPEQAELNQLDIDTRSDVYSLGVVLYELLTGTTPLERRRLKDTGLVELLRIIREEEPPRPSARLSTTDELPSITVNRSLEPKKLSGAVRGELDWIVMKALEKGRNRRYDSANGFAADIGRYLADEPVQACPPSAGYQLRKFARRNRRTLATAGVLGAVLLAAVGGVAWTFGWANRDREARQAAVDQEATLALKEAERLGEQGKWPQALSATKRAEGVLAGGGSEGLRERARERRRDAEMVLSVEDARLQGLDSPKDGKAFDYAAMDAAYLKAFRDYGIDVEALAADQAAERIRARPIRLELTGALDAWASQPIETRGDKLLAIARAADPDELRNRVRDALWVGQRSRAQLAELATSQQVRALPPSTLCALGNALVYEGLTDDAVALLRDAQQRHPDDFWINLNLAWALEHESPQPMDEVVRFYSAALALRPSSIHALYALGRALLRTGRPDEAMAYFRKVIDLDPNQFMAHNELGDTLAKEGRLDEAIAEYRTASALDPRIPGVQRDLGKALWRKGQPEEAVACFKKAVELSSYFGVTPAGANAILGKELAQVGRWNEAAAAFDRRLEREPANHDCWCLAAALHAAVGDLEGYRRTCREMLEHFGDTDQPQTAERTANACLLLPDALDAADFDRVQKLAERAVTDTEKDSLYRNFVLTKGLADYRAGRHADAVKWLQHFAPNPNGVHWDATAFAVLAMAQHGLGHAQEAQASLAKAKAILAKMPDPAKGQLFAAGNWHDWVHAQILCREAEGLLKTESGVRNQESDKK